MRPGKARQRKVIRRMIEIPIIFKLAFIIEVTTGPYNIMDQERKHFFLAFFLVAMMTVLS